MIWKELETIKKRAQQNEVVHKKVAILTGSLVTYHKDLVRNTKKNCKYSIEWEEGQAENNPLFDVIITIKKNVKKSPNELALKASIE